MSTEVIGVIDRGFATVKDHQGRPMNVAVFVFQTVTNEAAPENVIAFCNPIYREQVRKSFNRLTWVKMQEKQDEGAKAEGVEEMVKAENKPKGVDFFPNDIGADVDVNNNNVIPAEAGIQEVINVRRCRVCGCTDNNCSQCIKKTGAPCHWVKEDLCSACSPPYQGG